MKTEIPLKNKVDTVAKVLKSLSHPQRLLILCHLSSGEKTVTELVELCNVSQSGVSQFLARMKLEGLIDSRKDGHFVYYSTKDPRVSKLVEDLHQIFCA